MTGYTNHQIWSFELTSCFNLLSLYKIAASLCSVLITFTSFSACIFIIFTFTTMSNHNFLTLTLWAWIFWKILPSENCGTHQNSWTFGPFSQNGWVICLSPVFITFYLGMGLHLYGGNVEQLTLPVRDNGCCCCGWWWSWVPRIDAVGTAPATRRASGARSDGL